MNHSPATVADTELDRIAQKAADEFFAFYADSKAAYRGKFVRLVRDAMARAAGAPAETAKAVKRYDLECEERMGGWATENVMNENATGEWVRYEDLAAPQIDATTAPAKVVAIMRDGRGGAWAELTEAGESMPEGSLCYTAPATAPDVAKDAARLDWLLPNLHPANFGLDFEGGYEWESEAEFLSKFRAAIDAQIAAMGALPPTGSEKGGA